MKTSRRYRDDYHDYVGSRYWGDEPPSRSRRDVRDRLGDRDGRDSRDRNGRDGRDRNGRDGRDDRGGRDARGARDTRSGRDARDTRDARDAKDTDEAKEAKEDEKEPMVGRKRRNTDAHLVTSKTGGAYIPPAKLKLMQARITDNSSTAFQGLAWEALKQSIHGLINKVNISNIRLIVESLFRENVVRGRGLLVRSIIQAASSTFTNVYAALVAIINSKFPNIGS